MRDAPWIRSSRPAGSSRWLRLGLTGLLALVCTACELCPDELLPTRPSLFVDPEEVHLTGAGVAQDTPITITLSNPSNVALRIDHIRLEEDHDPAFRLQSPPTEVLAGGEARVTVMVRPRVISTIETTLLIEAEEDALPSPFVEVPITVEAVDLGLPDIEVRPDELDFERVGQFDVAFGTVEIRNVGVRDLILDEVRFEPEEEGDESIAIQGAIQPGWPVAPGGTVNVSLTFNPEDIEPHCGELVILSNDPDEEEVRVPVCGRGSECPVAVSELLEDPDDIEPLDTLRFYGGDSYTDVDGVDIEGFSWQLTIRPPGSTAVLSDPAAPQTQLTVDLAGAYEVCLEVHDTDGIRSCNDACIRVNVIPTDALHVQLVWDHPSADLDLHFLREGGTAFTHEGDTYFSNREPEWFPETPESNPRLDLDDNRGYGPENVNVEQPFPGSRWRVFVHYWNKQTDGDAFTLATLRLYAYGALVGEFTQSFDADETLWRAVEVVWSDTPPDPETGGGEPPTLNVLGQVEPFSRPF